MINLVNTDLNSLAKRAVFLHSKRELFPYLENLDVEDIFDLLLNIEKEKYQRDILTDTLIEYNDEIIEIEELGDSEAIDISVSGDNLFYANNILTKNSFGLPATVDLMFALIATEELDQMNQLMVKQLKNRYNDPTINKRFVIGIDRAKMKLYDLEQSAQKGLSDSGIKLDTKDFDNYDVGNIIKKGRDFSGIKL
jgi:hypothetical protein